MDEFLFDRWQAASAPFDGQVLCHGDVLPVAALRRALRNTVARLKSRYGEIDLVAVNDWHEHDGVILPGRAASWREIEAALKSDAALFEARHDDDFVYRAFYPSNGEFLLRFDVFEWDSALARSWPPEPEYRGIWGRFDLAAPLPVLQAVFAELGDDPRQKFSKQNAKRYFDDTYAG